MPDAHPLKPATPERIPIADNLRETDRAEKASVVAYGHDTEQKRPQRIINEQRLYTPSAHREIPDSHQNAADSEKTESSVSDSAHIVPADQPLCCQEDESEAQISLPALNASIPERISSPPYAPSPETDLLETVPRPTPSESQSVATVPTPTAAPIHAAKDTGQHEAHSPTEELQSDNEDGRHTVSTLSPRESSQTESASTALETNAQTEGTDHRPVDDVLANQNKLQPHNARGDGHMSSSLHSLELPVWHQLTTEPLILDAHGSAKTGARDAPDTKQEVSAIEFYTGAQALQRAGELLETARDSDDRYAAAAVGYSIRHNERTLSGESDTRDSFLDDAIATIGSYAIQMGHDTLAQHAFTHLPPERQWLLYGSAYESVKSPQQLSEWRIHLEQTEQDIANNTPAINRARLLAAIKIHVRNYADSAGTRPTLRQQAVEAGQELSSMLDEAEGHSETAELRKQLLITFARGHIWEGVRAADYGERMTELACKAAMGALEPKERQGLRLKSFGRFLRWMDEYQKGNERNPPPKALIYSDIVEAVLGQLAPKPMVTAGFYTATYPEALQQALALNDLGTAQAYYAEILHSNNPYENMRAALSLSQYRHEIEIAQAAHPVFERALLKELKEQAMHLSTHIRAKTISKAEITTELRLLYEQVEELGYRNPFVSLPVQARTLQLYLSILPDALETSLLRESMESRWTALEQQKGSMNELAHLSQLLRQTGLQFIRQWKPDGSNSGYIGYTPWSPLTTRQTPQWYMQTTINYLDDNMAQLPLITIANLVDTAEQLNHLLGERRYWFEFSNPEDIQTLTNIDLNVTSQRLWLLVQRPKGTVQFQGPWRQLYPVLLAGEYNEFGTATNALNHERRLKTDMVRSEQLRRLIEDD